jgi:hypothetical protein
MTPEQLSKIEANRQAALKKLSKKVNTAQTPVGKQSSLYSFFTPKSSAGTKKISQDLLSSPPTLSKLRIESANPDAKNDASDFNRNPPSSPNAVLLNNDNFELGLLRKEKRIYY